MGSQGPGDSGELRHPASGREKTYLVCTFYTEVGNARTLENKNFVMKLNPY